MIGQSVSHYQILRKLGQGGMGAVYLADDTILERQVALKFLPEEMQADETARRRFLREAKSAAALDHPFICNIHEIGEFEGHNFIVMEYVEGETLKGKLAAGPLPLEQGLQLASEIAEALEKAHNKKIVHRDLKPSNIMLTPEGHVKVMDFGLAKRVIVDRVGSSERTLTGLTKEGSTLGTIPYMSPEQVRGESVDTRSDLFSFGVVLYELITGVHPYLRSGQMETASAILRDDPPPLGHYIDNVPPLLQHTLDRMLVKPVRSRFQSVREVSTNLNQVMSGRGSVALLKKFPGGSWPGRWIALVGVAALAGLLILWMRTPELQTLRLINPVQLTSAVGVENYATWSPDGGRVAYESDQSGNWDVWVKQPGGGDSVNLTADHAGPDRYPAWSPDGRRIAFLSQRDQTWSLYTMAAVGGTPRRIISLAIEALNYSGTPQWSADGTRIAVAVWNSGHNSVQVVSLRTQEARQVSFPQHRGNPCLDLSWSPDGHTFAYVEADGDAAEVTRLWTVPASGGESVPVTDGRTNDRSPIWSADGRRLFFVSNRGGTMDLWQQRMGKGGNPEGGAEPVTTGLGIRSAVFSFDHARMIYSRGRPVSNVWRLPILKDRRADWADAEQITFDNALVQFIDLSPDGTRLAVSSDRAGNQDLWILPSQGGPLTQLTTDPTPDWAPRWSPDGREIVFYAYRAGNRDIWVMPSAGGPARPLTSDPAEEAVPIWSPDGSQVAFTSRRSGNRDVWIVDASGGEARQLTVHTRDETVVDWSPDGRWLVFLSGSRLLRISQAGGEPEALAARPGPQFGARLSPDGQVLYYLGRDNLRAVSLKDGREYPVTNLAGRRGTLGWGIATDGHSLYFTWSEETGDLWVMDVADSGK